MTVINWQSVVRSAQVISLHNNPCRSLVLYGVKQTLIVWD